MGLTRLRPLVPIAVIAGALSLVPVPTCLMRVVLGVPCPGCGMTRAVLAALRLDWAASLHLHPLGLPLLAGGSAVCAAAFFLDEPRWRRLLVWSTGLAGVALMVVWVLRFAGLFGGPVPV